jgi:hypothetical protein
MGFYPREGEVIHMASKRIARTVVTLIAAGGLLVLGQPTAAGAAARCDHGFNGTFDSFSHSHSGAQWFFHGHSTAGGNHVHTMHNHSNNGYDVANFCPT